LQCSSPCYAIIIISAVVIDLEFPSYTVNEEDGTVEVCAMLAGGSLGRTVVVTLSTRDGTAIGWYMGLLKHMFCVEPFLALNLNLTLRHNSEFEA
jgi:hypothetical protein